MTSPYRSGPECLQAADDQWREEAMCRSKILGLIKPSVIHELVAQACAASAADGHNPSFPRVYERIGRKGRPVSSRT